MQKKFLRSVFTFILTVILIIPLLPSQVHAAYENTYKNTGNMRNDIIGVALTQVGYREGSNNYTKYGKWYGQPNAPWCGMFVSWCAKEAGIPTSVLKRTGIANPKNYGLSYKSGSSYTPKKGDLFFKKSFSHVGLVYYTEGAYFYTIEGNTSTSGSEGHSVMIRKRKISDYYFSSPNYKNSGSSDTSCSHDYVTKYDSKHPHKQYKLCTKCNKKSYTGKTKTSDSCKTCIQANCDHDYSAWKTTGSSKHSKVCSKCDKTVTQSHDWVGGKILKEATCTESGKQQLKCSVCGAESTKTIKATGKHIYSDYTYLDETSHQKVCTTCGKQTSAKHTLCDDWACDPLYHWTGCKDCGGQLKHTEHVYSNGCLAPCDICGYTQENGHKLPALFDFDDNGHWKTCETCGEKALTASHVFTSDCDEICNDCGYRRTAPKPHQDVIHADATGHWYRCTSCTRVTDIISHIPDEHAEEWDNLHCSVCGFELRSQDNHVHTFEQIQWDAQTHWGVCACGEILAPEVHTWDFKTGVCSVCGCENTTQHQEASINPILTFFKRLFH